MQKKRLAFDSIFVVISIVLFSVIRVFMGRSQLSNGLEPGNIFIGVSVPYSIFLYFGIIIVYIIYGWALRRWFIKNEKEEKDNSLKHVYVIFVSMFLLVIINYIVVYLLNLTSTNFYKQITFSVFEIIQLVVVSTTIGILFYPQIEKYLGVLIFKQNLQADERKLGLGSFQKQVRFYSKKYWKILMVVLGVVLLISDFLLFLIYPSIPVAANEGLPFFYPNFRYSYNPSTGYRQQFFVYSSIPSSVLVDWKLVQSVLSIFIIVFMFLIIYLPKTNNAVEGNNPQESVESPEQEITQDDIAYNILTPTVKLEEYRASHQIRSDSKNKKNKFLSKAFNKDFIGVMGLLCLNFALSMVIIFILQNMGFISTSSLQLNDIYDYLYIDLTHLFWAGFAEEITFRWLIFGLPLFFIYGVIYLILRLMKNGNQKSKNATTVDKTTPRFLEGIRDTNPFLYLIGGWKRIDFISFVFLIFSSLTFGYVHYASGWDAWKIFQAGVSGIIFGYAYIKYGLHAAILLHATNNFIIGYLTTPNLGLIIGGEAFFLIFTFVGAFLLLYLTMIALSKFFKGINILFRRYNKDLS